MTSTRFSKKLIADYIVFMKTKYDVERTEDEADSDLDSLGELFLVFTVRHRKA